MPPQITPRKSPFTAVGTAVASTAAVTGVSVLAYIIWDYKTCHPFRKMTGYQVYPDAWARFHNTLLRPIWTYSTFNLSQLAEYDGRRRQSSTAAVVYFSSDGYVYDVSSSSKFQQSYGQWRGKDASFALAKMSMSSEDINRTDWESLSPEEWKSLHSWTTYFWQKYPIRGRLKEFQPPQP
jgi:predicted heme/steroid binding protein